MDFNTLKEEYNNCKKCPLLQESKMQVVFGSGNKNADILLIGEAPGATEAKNGIPFCGMSGKILDELLNDVGIEREDVFITNTILCRPPQNRNPKKEEVENCRSRLDKLISIMDPKVIVTIGNFATERILGKTGITKLRGYVYPVMINGVERRIVPVVHPASYLYSGRNPDKFEKMKADFKTIASIANIEKSQKSLDQFS
ncbi:uracil-DNA glycosylase [Candidatus Woesearchaeota archaeon]|nr:uracil-DNA glycosylase [Candidatus Woesearchaeota archaeon]